MKTTATIVKENQPNIVIQILCVQKCTVYTQFTQNSIHISRPIHYTVYSMYTYWFILKNTVLYTAKKQLMGHTGHIGHTGHTGHTVRYFVITFIMSIYYTYNKQIKSYYYFLKIWNDFLIVKNVIVVSCVSSSERIPEGVAL